MKNTTTGRHETTLQRDAALADQLLTDLVEVTYDLDAGRIVEILAGIDADDIELWPLDHRVDEQILEVLTAVPGVSAEYLVLLLREITGEDIERRRAELAEDERLDLANRGDL